MSTLVENLSATTAQTEYESAGLLPLFQDDQGQLQVIVADRQKKPKDLIKDSSGQQDILVGKPVLKPVPGSEKQIPAEVPAKCMRREVTEESGGFKNDDEELEDPLDSDFEQRATPLVTTDPEHIIHLFVGRLNAIEVARFTSADLALQHWPKNQDRVFSAITGCDVPARKSSKGLYACPAKALLLHLIAFSKFPKSGNRLQDANKFVKEAPRVVSTSLGRPGVTINHAFRPFVIVLLENFIPEIAKAIGYTL